MQISKQLRILDFDVEARPLSWYGGDWVTKEITAIAASWMNSDRVYSYCLRSGNAADRRAILDFFVELYDEADMVTGHYIRGFDLPLINAGLVEAEMPLLEDKLASDTKLDLLKFSGLSKSQENIGALLGLEAPKVQMDQAKWRSANRLEPAGIAETRDRVIGDVVQHKEMRAALIERGMLAPPKVWKSKPSASAKYTP